MVISRKTPIIDLLKAEKEAVLDRLIQLNPNFSRLRNPVLRNVLARMVDIEGACKVAGCEVPAFLEAMQQIGFVVQDQTPAKPAPEVKQVPISRGAVRVLDVRPILAEKKDPLKLILEHVDELGEDECLKLIAPFEPVPLIHMLQAKGFSHEIEQEEGSVITYLKKAAAGARPVTTPQAAPRESAQPAFEDLLLQYKDRLRTIDVRHLDMPKPMIMILENLQEMQDGEALFVYHKKLPVYLLPHLQERGYEHSTKPTDDGKMNLIIYKP